MPKEEDINILFEQFKEHFTKEQIKGKLIGNNLDKDKTKKDLIFDQGTVSI